MTVWFFYLYTIAYIGLQFRWIPYFSAIPVHFFLLTFFNVRFKNCPHLLYYLISFFPNWVTASTKNRANTTIAHGRNGNTEKAASEVSAVKSWRERKRDNRCNSTGRRSTAAYSQPIHRESQAANRHGDRNAGSFIGYTGSISVPVVFQYDNSFYSKMI